jgi:beta-glucosidase/6-phospho-beta-glucosidase/beta-galactosidase
VFGVNSHIASRYPDFGTLPVPAAVVSELGGGWVREDVQWSRVEPAKGAYDWTWHDTVFRMYQRNGINIIGVLGPAVGWGTSETGDPENGVSFFAPDPDTFAAFAAAVAHRYRGIVNAWEIWNEPENPLFWQPSPDPAAYAHLLIKTSNAI